MKLRLKRSNVVENGAPKPPTSAQMEYGELAINYDAGVGPVIYTKNDTDDIVKILPKVTTLVVTDKASSAVQVIGGKLKTENTVSGDADEMVSTKKYVDDINTANLARTVLDDVSTNQQIAGKISLTTATTSSDPLLTLTDRTYVDAGDALKVPIAGGITMGGVLGWYTSQTFPAAKVTGTLNNSNSGNAATATALATARTIGGTNFDGTANIDIAELNGQAASYYLNASNLNAGTVPDSRLPSASTSDAGIVQLTASTSSSSTTLAPTAAAYAATHTLAANALSKTDTNNQTMAGTISFSGNQQLPVDYITTGTLPTGVSVSKLNIVDETLTDTQFSTAAGDRLSGSKVQQAGANEANYGVIKLTDATTTTSSVLGASATAVKAAFDKAAQMAVTVNESAPVTDLVQGQLWWDSSTNAGSCFIYYDDYWVPLVASAGSLDYSRTVLRDITTLQTITSKVQADSNSYTVSGDNDGTLTTKGYVDSNLSTKLSTSGGTMTGNISFGDEKYAIFGADSDLIIGHRTTSNGSTLQFTSAMTIGTSNKTCAKFYDASTVELYFNNNLKAKTVSAGFNVTGNLGIGDTAPSFKLVVKGQSRFGNTDNISPNSVGNGHIMIAAQSYTGYVTCDNNAIYLGHNSATSGLGLQTNETNRLFISSSGNVGIGTGSSAPSSLLHLKGGLPVLQFTITGGSTESGWSKLSMEAESSPNLNKSIWECNGSEAYGHFVMRQSSGGGATRDVLTIDNSGDIEVPQGDIKVTTGDIKLGAVNLSNGSASGVEVSDGGIMVLQVPAFPIFPVIRAFSSTDQTFTVWSDGKIKGMREELYGTSTAGYDLLIIKSGPTGSDTTTKLIQFANFAGTEVGKITRNGAAAVSYTTTSDYRLKEKVSTLSDGIIRLKQLKPCRFNFIADPDDDIRDGFLAHEVQVIVPEAVSGVKDEMKDEEYEVTPATDTKEAVMGTRSIPEYQGIDQAKLVPLLTAALQETIAELEILKGKVTALENS
tara:strand:+ start:109 stop:3102 length:2994 start_codon:yes stop_codon:yes gene_type:complete